MRKSSIWDRIVEYLDNILAWILDNFIKIMIIVSIIIALLGIFFFKHAPKDNMSTPYEHYLY